MDSKRFVEYLESVKETINHSTSELATSYGQVDGRSFENLGVQIIAINTALRRDGRRVSFKSSEPRMIVQELALNGKKRNEFISRVDYLISAIKSSGTAPAVALPENIPLNLDELVDDYIASRDQQVSCYQIQTRAYQCLAGWGAGW